MSHRAISILFVIALYALIPFTLNRLSDSKGAWNSGPYFKIFYIEMAVMMIPAIAIIFWSDVRHLWLFSGVDDSSYFISTVWLFYGLMIFCLSLIFFDKAINSLFGVGNVSSRVEDYQFIVKLLLMLQVLTLLVIFVYAKNFPILGAFTGENIGVLRKSSTLNFNGPKPLLPLIRFLGNFALIYLGVLRGKSKKPKFFILAFFTSLFSLVWTGEKSPVVIGVMEYFFAKYWSGCKKIKVRTLLGLIIIVLLFLLLLFTLVYTNRSFDEILEYFYIRTFLGQLSGYYQALSIVVPDKKYIYSWIPFSSYIFGGDNVASFNRELMLLTEGNTLTGGVKNSFFLHEAYGTLGTLGLVLSPIWAAVVLVIASKVIKWLFGRIIGSYFGLSSVFIIIFRFHLTGGFGSIAFFRFIFYPLFVLGAISVFYILMPKTNIRE